MARSLASCGKQLLFVVCMIVCITTRVAGAFDLCLLHTGGTYGQVLPVNSFSGSCPPPADGANDCQGGVSRRAEAIDIAKQACTSSGVLLLDGGNFLQGPIFFHEFKANASAAYYGAMQYDAVALHQRDFLTGLKDLLPFLQLTSIPGIASNMDISQEPRFNGYVFPYKVWSIGGTKVGFTSEIAANLLDVTGALAGNISVSSSIPALRVAVGEMLEEHVNIVIVAITSLAITDIYTLLDSCYGIDYIIYETENVVSNSTDSIPISYTTPWGAKVLLVGDGTFGRRLAWLNLTFDEYGSITDYAGASKILTNATANDPTVEAIVEQQYDIIVASKQNTVGFSNNGAFCANDSCCFFAECSPCDYHSDAMRRYTGAQLALIDGGVCGAGLPKGNITMQNLITAFPFDDSDFISVIWVTGEILWQAIESGLAVATEPLGALSQRFPQVSGLVYYWNPSLPVGERVVHVYQELANGQKIPLPRNGTTLYSVTINSFMRGGGDGYTMFRDNVTRAVDGLTDSRSMILEDLAKLSPITFPSGVGRIFTTDEVPFTGPPKHYDDYYIDWDTSHAIVLIILSITMAIGLVVVLIGVIVLWILKEPSIRGTKLIFNCVQICSMIIACFIIFIFIGKPTDAYCAVRPWTSLVFTLVFGNLIAKQIAMTAQSFINIAKKQTDSIMRVKYKWYFLICGLAPMLIVHVIYLILWTSIDHPKEGREDASGNINSQLTCRSTDELPFLIILFVGFLLEMLIGVVCSVWLYHVPVFLGEAKMLGFIIYAVSLITVVIVVLFNALRVYPVAVFYLLGLGNLLAIFVIAVLLYAPVVYLMCVRLLGRHKTAPIDTNFVPAADKGDGLDDL
eukprot:TRINITY_DN7384_c0_g2_i3.p1 TRINITY_DN7384_c0_g2~~TRINITY_DN7384_c0_g2_i3.p1  ORF type:complete len:853 (+),score=95.08 TRINITY_DN7384_c0_g2_i3:165-2723(+)